MSDAGTAIELPDWRGLRSRAKAGEQLRDEVVATLATQRSDLLLSIGAAALLGERAPIAAPLEASHAELASDDHGADQARQRTHAT